MYDQTQSSSPSGMGGRASSPNMGSFDGGQADDASISRKLRVRIAGTALFTVGLAALSYSMVNDKQTEEPGPDGKATPKPEVSDAVKNELPPDYLKTDLDNSAINPNSPVTPPIAPPTTPSKPVVTEAHSHSHVGPPPHNLHDFSSCGDFPTAFAHARAEIGGPGEIFIYKGKPYTTTYKHEVEDGGQIHVKEGLEVEIVIAETENGKVIAADTDNDGFADKWYVETNDTRYELIDSDGDGKLDSYIEPDGDIIALNEAIDSSGVTVPPSTYDIVTMDGVEFLAYDNDSNGQFDKLIGEHEGKYLYYEDTDGDGNFDHAAIVSGDLSTVEHTWAITPMNVDNGHIEVPSDFGDEVSEYTAESDEASQAPITTPEDLSDIGDDPYRVDIEHEINSGDLNNHTDMSDFGH